MKIAIWAEHTVLAGRECFDEEKVERQSDDVVIYEGTPQELYRVAIALRKTDDAPGRANRFNRRVSDTLLEAGAHL